MNHYEVLGVSKEATQEEIIAAYRKKRSSAHPDKKGDAAQFHKIQKAYEVLSDPVRRADYDATGRDGGIVENRHQQMLVGMILIAIDATNDIDHVDILVVIRRHINETIINLDMAKKQAKKEIIKFKKAAKRLKKKDNSDNWYVTIILNNVSILKKCVEAIEVDKKFNQELLTLLNELSYEVDKKKIICKRSQKQNLVFN